VEWHWLQEKGLENPGSEKAKAALGIARMPSARSPMIAAAAAIGRALSIIGDSPILQPSAGLPFLA
jgi:hypothetical protein